MDDAVRKVIKVLLVEDDPADSRLVRLMIPDGPALMRVEAKTRLGDAIDQLGRENFDVCLLDLGLPDSQGLGTVERVIAASAELPIVILTGNDDDSVALDALRLGAQDFLVKGDITGPTLHRVIRYAIERKEVQRQLRRSEEQLRAAKDEAERAARMKSEFLAVMGHEIRTPLGGMLGMLNLLLSSKLESQQRSYAEKVMISGEHLLGIVNDILDFSRMDAGRMTLESVPYEAADLFESVLAVTKPLAESKGLALSVRVCDTTPRLPVGDPHRLKQVLVNLVSNAAKFTEHGGVALDVEAQALGGGHHLLRFSVTDTGIGINSEAQRYLFSEFVQADTSTSRKYGGTGLGLSICRKLVSLMGGEIGVISTPGQGSVFWFTIPAAEAAAGAVPVSMTAAKRSADHVLKLPPLAVLVTDDNRTNREIAAALLEKEGHRVGLASDGGEAVLSVAEHHWDVVLMDVRMPGVDGLEATRMIRALGGPSSTTPIIALTADSGETIVEQCLSAGANGFLSKPLRLVTVMKEIARVLGLVAGTTTMPAEAPLPSAAELLDVAVLTEEVEMLGLDRYLGLLDVFRAEGVHDLGLIISSAAEQNLPVAQAAAHKLLSGSLSLNMATLARRCREIEKHAMNGLADEVARAATGIQELYDNSFDACARFLAGLA